MSARRRYIFPDDYVLRDAVLFPDDIAAQSFSYSDGDEAENYLLEVLSKAKDRSLFSEELKAAIRDWPSRYHLSRKRANLLRPFAPFLRGRVLETGAGCGAITRFLGENGGEIVAVEGSARRAKIARVRTEDLANVTVVCDRVENLRAVEKFDANTVVGVLEYAGVYDNDDPYRKFLRDVASKLSDDGVVILAIENKLGLKYLAGAREDHTGGEFDGINDGYRAKSPTTFGGAELAGLLRDSGLTAQAWYVPSPDYKLPDTILSGALITAHPSLAASLASQTALSDPQRPSDPTFSLEQAWQVVGKNYLLGELANSFLVVCAKNESAIIPFISNDGLAWHYNVDRHAAFTKATEFVRAGDGLRVERHALANADAPSVPISQQLSGEPFREGKNWWGELSSVVNRPNWTVGEVADWAKVWLKALARECGLKNVSAEIFPRYVDGKYFDAAPFNLSVDEEGNARFFDQEWKLGPQVEFGYLAFRGLRDSLARIFSYATPQAGTPQQINQLIIAVLGELGVFLTRAQIDRFTEIEGRVQAWVQGQSAVDISQEYIAQSWNAVISVRSAVERSALSASIGQLRSENSRLQGVEEELSRSQASQSLLQNDLAKVREDNSALTSQLSANGDLLRESQGLTQKLSGELAHAREELEKRFNEDSARAAELEAQRNDAVNQIIASQAEVSEAQKHLNEEIERSRELSAALESERATAKELLRKIAERDALVDLRTRERDAASGKLAQLEVLLEQESKRAIELSAALKAERTSVAKTQSELAESHSLAELRTRERDGASRQLAQVFSELSRLRQTSAQLQNERARAEQLAAELERDRGELRVARAHADRLSNGLAEQARILEGVENRESRQRGFIRKLFSGANGTPTASERLQIDAIRSSKLFSAVTYLQRYPDVASAKMDPLLHYIRYGENEARQVHYLFDAAYYRRNCAAASRVKMTSLAHYQSIGILSGNDPHALFDTDFYMQQLGDKSASTLNPVAHFCEEGWRAGMNPHPLFDTKYYLLQNPDVRSAGENPLIHYCVFGWRERRNPSAAFDVSVYLREHRDVALANTDPLAHYSEYGKVEGRAIQSVG
ncbi:MAG TPA: methyltransferase domain-containing protein [Xanthobacteraceae bacterium]|nr:methyltransferase domain-containing protein [Xanthobacteraceae bacterium]